MKFKSVEQVMSYLCSVYAPLDLQNSCGYTFQTWDEVKAQLKVGDVHTYVGDWFYFGVGR